MRFAKQEVVCKWSEVELVQVPGRVVAIKVSDHPDEQCVLVEFTYVERKPRESK